ncbi:membrane-bound metal-dependent hydrolase [Fictibacillus macauensis ZFHKF-1]|uniref:Membrane-bound metal-dependent hydrolase n=1 Tax=Fictibacillus macauensis ZFHKF-1 TaxID=1196324 RepID=I8UCL7_9BACL|nr:metal-dependent hydrolase [Fictibacillus macauensis]EIT84670.1 membrane-bound metal-dependent hydrolase [Fictibacillus macauensis ZFHKF-1]
MDTGTHIVMGLGLGGLAMLDPVVSADPITAQAVLIGTLVGSQAPDFDTILKLKNNAVYIRNHRGITHSVPALLIWPALLAPFIHLFFPESNGLHLWLWTSIAVIIHVFVDIFNAYGTQALYPFSKRWVALGVINIFDPFIFITHLVALALWYVGFQPGIIFAALYVLLIAYYIARIWSRHRVARAVATQIPETKDVIISPSLKWSHYHIAVKTKRQFFVANMTHGVLTILDTFDRMAIPNTPIMHAAMNDKNISAFLSFSPVYRWEAERNSLGYEVRFIDLRYRSKGHYPFVALVQLDHQLKCVTSYTGWVYSEDRLRKKMDITPSKLIKN